jgi:hypothetical protein
MQQVRIIQSRSPVPFWRQGLGSFGNVVAWLVFTLTRRSGRATLSLLE